MVVDRRRSLLSWPIVLLLAIAAGCNSGESQPATPDTNQTAAAGGNQQASVQVERYESPDETVRQFLTALKTGDQPRATRMLTVTAQQEMAKSEATIQPPGSSTAQFEVTQVEILGDQKDGAHVLSQWTDKESDGTTSSHEIVWILRRETSGWAIAGFGTRVFEDQPPLILNFEDPQELQRKRAAVDAEIARRNEPQTVRQAQLPPDTSLR
jgi:hypothetical protein